MYPMRFRLEGKMKMTQKELCEQVRDVCVDAGLDFIFILPGASGWSVSVNSDDHLRRMAVLHEKYLDTVMKKDTGAQEDIHG